MRTEEEGVLRPPLPFWNILLRISQKRLIFRIFAPSLCAPPLLSVSVRPWWQIYSADEDASLHQNEVKPTVICLEFPFIYIQHFFSLTLCSSSIEGAPFPSPLPHSLLDERRKTFNRLLWKVWMGTEVNCSPSSSCIPSNPRHASFLPQPPLKPLSPYACKQLFKWQQNIFQEHFATNCSNSYEFHLS